MSSRVGFEPFLLGPTTIAAPEVASGFPEVESWGPGEDDGDAVGDGVGAAIAFESILIFSKMILLGDWIVLGEGEGEGVDSSDGSGEGEGEGEGEDDG